MQKKRQQGKRGLIVLCGESGIPSSVQAPLAVVLPRQAPVVTFNQPLFAFGKHLHLNRPEKRGESTIFVLFAVLHIEVGSLKTLGDWLDGSGGAQTGAI